MYPNQYMKNVKSIFAISSIKIHGCNIAQPVSQLAFEAIGAEPGPMMKGVKKEHRSPQKTRPPTSLPKLPQVFWFGFRWVGCGRFMFVENNNSKSTMQTSIKMLMCKGICR